VTPTSGSRTREEQKAEPAGERTAPAPAPAEPIRSPPALAGVLALQSSAGNAAVTRMLIARQPKTADPPKAEVGSGYPWPGTIDTMYNAALRSTPAKAEDDPHGNTIADLPKGTNLTVVGKEHGWLRVEVQFEGKQLTGFVSHELVKRVPVMDFSDEPDVIIGAMSLSNAFLSLKRAEVKRAADPKWAPQSPVKEMLEQSKETVEGTGKYEVDAATFRVSFKKPAGGAKITITSIQDFILFVETVEREYPSATPREVAGEVRQIWFSDENWDVLLDSPGIRKGGVAEDIETEPNPIAKQFDMKDLAPKGKGKTIATRLGNVDVGHVLAGIDATLSGAPASTPAGKDELKWKTLHDANKGEPRDFATWSGDLGQAYAEYLVARWVKNETIGLKPFVDDKAPRDQLLGDIHGYLAVKISGSMPPDASPTGADLKVSSILRNLYLVGKKGAGMGEKTYFNYMQESAKKSVTEIRPFIVERTLAFARPWYAKKAVDHKGWSGSKGWGKEGILENAMKDFDEKHALNESKALESSKLVALVDNLLDLLSEIMP
jgi:hypothetical protein